MRHEDRRLGPPSASAARVGGARAIVLREISRNVLGADQTQVAHFNAGQLAGLDVSEHVRPAYAGSLGQARAGAVAHPIPRFGMGAARLRPMSHGP